MRASILKQLVLGCALIGSTLACGDAEPSTLSMSSSASDFWARFSLGGAMEGQNFRSLAEMVEYADLIVVGEVVAVADSRASEGTPGDVQRTASITLDVAEVLRGSPMAPHDETKVSVRRSYNGDLPTLEGPMDGRSLVFLRDAERLGKEVGQPDEQAEQNRGVYVLVSSHGVLVETSSGVEAPLRASGEEGFAAAYASDDLDDVIAAVRAS